MGIIIIVIHYYLLDIYPLLSSCYSDMYISHHLCSLSFRVGNCLSCRNISYADCFDRESLVKRLIEARDGLVQPSSPPPAPKEDEKPPPASSEPSSSSDDETKQSSNEEEFDRQATLTELRSLRIKELKVKLSEQKVRWGTMIEKDEMVQALCDALEDRFNKSKNFSRSGNLIPGSVGDIDESTLIKELGWLEEDVNRGVVTAASSEDSDAHAPILLDGKYCLSYSTISHVILLCSHPSYFSVCYLVWTMSVDGSFS